MKQLPRDVKSILTKTAFNIPPHLVGKTLASPKRRLLAFTLDYIFASILFKTVGSGLYAVIAVLLIAPLFIKSLRVRLKKSTRVFLVLIGVIMLIAVGAKQFKTQIKEKFVNPVVNGEFESAEDSIVVSKVLAKLNDKIDADTTGEARKALENIKIDEFKVGQLLRSKTSYELSADSIDSKKIKVVENFYTAFISKDSIAISKNWMPMRELIAGAKIEKLENEIDSLDEQIEELEEEVDDLKDQLAEPSFGYIVKAAINDIGLSLGWFAFYLIFCWFLFDGSSPAKKLLHIKIIRMNGHDLKLWYCFERFSGYAAGVATGLLGFMQIYWDDNRQCIHDKIASTVVIDLKPKKPKSEIKWHTRLIEKFKQVLKKSK